MRAISDPSQRGFIMVFVLFLVALLFIVTVAVVNNASAAANNAKILRQKNQAFDAAASAVDAAMNALDMNHAASGCTTGTISPSGGASYPYTSCIGLNNFGGTQTLSSTNPASGKSVSVPAGTAFVYGYGSSALTGERTYAVALVLPPTGIFQFPAGAVIAESSIAVSGGATFCASDATPSIPCGSSSLNDSSIVANGGIWGSGGGSHSQYPAEGTSNYGADAGSWLDQVLGYDGANGMYDTTIPMSQPVNLFTPQQAASFQTTSIAAAQSGTTMSASQFATQCGGTTGCADQNIYVNGNVVLSGSGVITYSGPGTLFINGSLCTSGGSSFHNAGSGTIVVANVANLSGAGYVVSGSTPGKLIGLGLNASSCPSLGSTTGSAGQAAIILSGSASSRVGLVYAVNGNVLVTGSGNVYGAIYSGKTNCVPAASDSQGGLSSCGDVSFSGSGAFKYDSRIKGFTVQTGAPGNVVVQTYAEY